MRGHGRDQLVICGVYAHVGILMTAHEGFSNDIQTFLVADAIADFSADFHRMALEYAADPLRRDGLDQERPRGGDRGCP